MSEFFNRVAILQLNKKLIGDLRIAFRIEKSLKPRPNQAEVKVWNLSEESRKQFDDNVYVSLQAGYAPSATASANINSIFIGNLDRVDHIRQGADWITSVRIGDGTKEIKKARINTSRRTPSRPADIVQAGIDSLSQVLSSKGFDIKIAAGNAMTKARQGDTQGALTTLTKGFVSIGNAFDEIVKVGNNLGYDVSIQDKQLLFLGSNETDGQKDFVLSAENGLVGSPELAEKEHVKCRALLNGELRPGRGVLLKSFNFNGRYRIEKCVMQGDTHGQDWFVDLELKKLG